jgi:hypothetical protein
MFGILIPFYLGRLMFCMFQTLLCLYEIDSPELVKLRPNDMILTSSLFSIYRWTAANPFREEVVHLLSEHGCCRQFNR